MINYSMLAQASQYYSDLGYERIEAPWLVSKEISDVTKPLGASTFIVQKDIEQKQKAFVSSGEQSFLYLINKGHLPSSGRFHTITPCLRNDMWDEIHMKQFMKLELIYYVTTVENYFVTEPFNLELDKMVDTCLKYFTKLAGTSNTVEVIKTDQGYDINMNGIEIGSYGIRSCLFAEWIYGTGLAEPRFSRILGY